MKDGSGRRVAKRDLPEKICQACGRPMVWRKRWAKTWEEVRYCSDKCRRARGGSSAPDGKTS